MCCKKAFIFVLPLLLAWSCLHAQITDSTARATDTLQVTVAPAAQPDTPALYTPIPGTAVVEDRLAAPPQIDTTGLAQKADSIMRARALAGTDTTQRNDSLSLGATDSTRVVTTTTAGKFEIRGRIIDRGTGEGIPFATVFFPSSPIGTPTDLDGYFALRFDVFPADTLMIQALGYELVKKRVDIARASQSYTIEVGRSTTELQEFVFKAGEDPALILLRQIIAHKPQNNPDKVQNYKYEVYNKMEVDLQRLSKEQFEKLPIPMMRKFSFIYDMIDTVSEEKPFLPFFLTETLSDYYFQRTPKKTKEFIKASLLKGVQNESVTKFLGSMYQNLNAYDNFIPVFDKQFVSPISNSGAFYYKYRIIDTQQAYGHNIILVQFTPRREGENCFYGDFWVVDSVYALQRVSMEVPKTANINWVNSVSLYQEYAPVSDTLWFCVKEKFIADFVAPYNVKLPGFIGRKSTSYQNIVVNDTSVTRIVNDPKLKADIIVLDDAREKTDEFWGTARHDTLTKNEKAIYNMVDTLNSLPLFTRYKNLVKFFATGVKEIGPIELGPYYYIYSNNTVEGPRFRFSMGTTPKLFKNIYLNGYVAYGLKDNRFKYKIAGLWLLNRKPRMYIYASYTHDIDRSTNYYDEVSSDNIFSVAVRKKNIPWKLAFANEARLEFFKEYYSGISHQITFLHKQFNPYEPLPSTTIFTDGNGAPAGSVISSEVNVKLRYAFKEQFLEGNYYRVSLGSKYPIVEARYNRGIKGVWGSGYEYDKLSVSISDNIKIAPLGNLYVNVFGGKMFGTVPYPLLQIQPGNEFYYYNKYAFNMMNQYEFLTDRYAGVNLEHTIGGGIFNYIPYVKRLKLRQFWTAKGVIGSLSDANKQLNFDKGYPFKTLTNVPYVELGTGIENIFQFFRIDFVWRVLPERLPTEKQDKYFGIFGSVRFNF